MLCFPILLVCFNPYFWARACFQVLGSWHKRLLQWLSTTSPSTPVHGAATWRTVKSLALQHSTVRLKSKSHSLLRTCSPISNLGWIFIQNRGSRSEMNTRLSSVCHFAGEYDVLSVLREVPAGGFCFRLTAAFLVRRPDLCGITSPPILCINCVSIVTSYNFFTSRWVTDGNTWYVNRLCDTRRYWGAFSNIKSVSAYYTYSNVKMLTK